VLLGNLDGYEFQDAPGISQRVDDVLGGEFAHDQCQIAFERCLDGASINPLHVFRDAQKARQVVGHIMLVFEPARTIPKRRAKLLWLPSKLATPSDEARIARPVGQI
jgi:hypothetical protein